VWVWVSVGVGVGGWVGGWVGKWVGAWVWVCVCVHSNKNTTKLGTCDLSFLAAYVHACGKGLS
jgi:hypothetical protein